MLHIIDLNFLEVSDAIASFLLPTSEGPILIETGPHATFKRLEKAIEKAGYAVSDIKHVLLTHIHLDHAGAAWAFAAQGATIYVHPAGARHLSSPERLMESARRIYKDDMDRLWGEMKPIAASQIKEVADGEALMFGDTHIRAWHTPGHAVHHIAWQCNESIFTGDVAGVRINKQSVLAPCPPPDIHVADWKASIAKIRSLKPTKLYLTHFGEVLDVEAHLDSLEQKLDDWAQWMKPYWEKGEDPKVITPLFQKYVQEQLLSEGVAQADLPRYEAANPSWMSVAGLMRYWKMHAASLDMD